MIVAAALLALASASAAPPPASVADAARAMNACIDGLYFQAEAGVRAEVAAASIVEYCQPQTSAYAAAYEQWIAGSTMSDREKARQRRVLRNELSGQRARIAARIRAERRRR